MWNELGTSLLLGMYKYKILNNGRDHIQLLTKDSSSIVIFRHETKCMAKGAVAAPTTIAN